MRKIKIIALIGYSGSGKTHFILEAIQLLKIKRSYNIGVIKNIHEHQIDKEGKDTYRYTKGGAEFSITKNVYNETTIFLKKKINSEELLEWISESPLQIDVVFLEGFRDINFPTILCVDTFEDIQSQINPHVKMISGKLLLEENEVPYFSNVPIIDIKKDFQKFLNLFEL